MSASQSLLFRRVVSAPPHVAMITCPDGVCPWSGADDEGTARSRQPCSPVPAEGCWHTPGRSPARTSAVPAHLVGEGPHVDRLLQVAGETVGEQSCTAGGVSQRRQGNDGDVRCSLLLPDRARDVTAL